jgi:hypothetical protein
MRNGSPGVVHVDKKNPDTDRWDLALALEPVLQATVVMPSVPPTNPRPVGVDDLRRILRAAWAGTALAE